MASKLLEAFFRHKLLVLLPPILITLIVAPIAFITMPRYYESSAGVWVDRPTYLSYSDNWNQWLTPAQNQAGALGEMLRTRTFQFDVARRTQLAPLVNTLEGQKAIQEYFAKNVALWPDTAHLLVVRSRAPTPELAVQLLNALLTAFRERASADSVRQAGLATAFYESRLKTADDQLAKTTDALKQFIAANPRYASIDPDRGAAATTAARLGLPPSAIDPQLGEILRQLDIDQTNAQNARVALDQSRYNASAALEGQQLGFQVVDAPRPPKDLTIERRKPLMYVVAGLLAGFGLSGAIVVTLAAGDHTIRYETELGQLVPVAPVLGAVPQLEIQRLPKRAVKASGPDLTRRAIGYVAGATMPALPAPQ